MSPPFRRQGPQPGGGGPKGEIRKSNCEDTAPVAASQGLGARGLERWATLLGGPRSMSWSCGLPKSDAKVSTSVQAQACIASACPRIQVSTGTRVMKGRLPAYAQRWRAAREAGLAPSGWLCVERAWPRRPVPWLIVVPGDDDPARYDLSLCAGLPVLVFCASRDNSNAVLVALIKAARPSIGAVIVDGQFSSWIGGNNA